MGAHIDSDAGDRVDSKGVAVQGCIWRKVEGSAAWQYIICLHCTSQIQGWHLYITRLGLPSSRTTLQMNADRCHHP